MNVYDFDNTIYDGDSTVDFCKYCMKRYPMIIPHVFPVGLIGISAALGMSTKDRFKAVLYKFLRRIPDIDDAVADFWKGHRRNVQRWYISHLRGSATLSAMQIPVSRFRSAPAMSSRFRSMTSYPAAPADPVSCAENLTSERASGHFPPIRTAAYSGACGACRASSSACRWAISRIFPAARR